MANSAVMLLYGMIFFKDGYVAAGQLTNATRQIKWPLDYFLKCSQNDGIFYGQVRKDNGREGGENEREHT